MFADYIGVWVLTTGLNSGVSKLIGQSIDRYTLLNEKSLKPTVIGLTRWGTLTERTREVLKWQVELVTITRLSLLLSSTFSLRHRMMNCTPPPPRLMDKPCRQK